MRFPNNIAFSFTDHLKQQQPRQSQRVPHAKNAKAFIPNRYYDINTVVIAGIALITLCIFTMLAWCISDIIGFETKMLNIKCKNVLKK